MIKDITDVKIGAVWNGGRGASYKDEIKAEVQLSSDLKLNSPLTAELLMVRMKEGVTVVLSNLRATLTLQCGRCLDLFEMEMEIPQMEAHFYENLPVHHYDSTEQFPIDRKNMSIDLTEALRQEIILHFPLIPVCSKSCRGLCPDCKVNLNHQTHRKGCTHNEKDQPVSVEEGTTRPFANLKDLLKK